MAVLVGRISVVSFLRVLLYGLPLHLCCSVEVNVICLEDGAIPAHTVVMCVIFCNGHEIEGRFVSA